jgi:hypothetical protein
LTEPVTLTLPLTVVPVTITLPVFAGNVSVDVEVVVGTSSVTEPPADDCNLSGILNYLV